MNILKRLNDDIQDIIYFKLHQSYMNDIKKEIWYKLSDELQDYFIETEYPTEYASYCVYDDDNGEKINPNKRAIDGKCRVVEPFDGDCYWKIRKYKGNILINPTYGELLLECDKLIIQTGDYRHLYFECFGTSGLKQNEEGILHIGLWLGS